MQHRIDKQARGNPVCLSIGHSRGAPLEGSVEQRGSGGVYKGERIDGRKSAEVNSGDAV